MKTTQKRYLSILSLVFAGLVVAGMAAPSPASTATPPEWAYPIPAPRAAADHQSTIERHVPGSAITLTQGQVSDFFNTPDWHPVDHPAMPDVVAHGRKPDIYACGFCHRADGPGAPENANLTGLSAIYIERQLADFKKGARTNAVQGHLPSGRLPVRSMIKIARELSQEEITASARYFASIPARSVVDVVETDNVPKTQHRGWALAPVPGGGTEPIGARIVEVPADLERFISRDSRVRYIAYVPPGSVAMGKALATSVAGRTAACGGCHGADLKGSDQAPSIVGRSPSYIVRQLFDFQAGTRHGTSSGPMQAVVSQLTGGDMIALAAYTASLKP